VCAMCQPSAPPSPRSSINKVIRHTKLLADHQGLDVRSLPIEPHYMTNVVNALKAKAGNN
jgi:hypothetical protein